MGERNSDFRSARLAVASLGLFLLFGCEGSLGANGSPAGSTDAATDAGTQPHSGSVVPAPPMGTDTDRDGDFLSDWEEGNGSIDTDGDGRPDMDDTDSDGDGILDELEVGDQDLGTAAIDTDGDGVPDFRDLDSDGDGLPDASERENETSPVVEDTDGDGVTDLVEVVAGTDPTNGAGNPRANGDFFFVVPYEEAPSPDRDTLVFASEIKRADVYFFIDSSASMAAEISALRDSLVDTVLPGLQDALADVQLGAGHYANCTTSLRAGYYGIVSEQRSTSNAAEVVDALNTIVSRVGGGSYEPSVPAAWLFATGDHSYFGTTNGSPSVAPRDCPDGGVGYGCVRPDALPILVVVGDESPDQGCLPGLTTSDVTEALNDVSAKLIVIGPGSNTWDAIARGTGSVDTNGNPYVMPLGAGSLSRDVIDAAQNLAESLPLELTARVNDVDDGESIDARVFIRELVANTTGGVTDPRDPTRICVGGLHTSDGDGDGSPDTFPAVTAGQPVCFDVVAAMNSTVMPEDEPQVFRARIEVIGEGITVLDTRDVFFLVPPRPDTPILI